MRQLFLPACVCLMAWSGSTNSGPRLTLDEAAGHLRPNKSGFVQSASLEPDAGAGGDAPAVKPSNEPDAPVQADTDLSLTKIASLIPDGAIEAPVPSGVVVNNGIPAGIPLPPIPKPVVARSTEEICGSLTDAAQRNDLPAPFFIRLLFQESRFEAGMVSSAGAQGIAQFMPDTAADVGLDNPFDPLQAIPASARLLRDLFQKFGNLGLAAAAYNAGSKRIQDWLESKGKDKLPEETQGYVKIITGRPVENWTNAATRHPGEKLPRRAPCQEAAGLLAWNGPDEVPVPSPSPLRIAAAKTKPDDIKTTKDDRVADKKDLKAEKKNDAQKIKETKENKETIPKPATTKAALDIIKPEKSAAKTSNKPAAHASTKVDAQHSTHKRRHKSEQVAQR